MSELSLVKNAKTPLGIYLDLIYEGGEGYVYSPVKNSDGYFDTHFFLWPDERAELEKHITTQTAVGEVYIAPALFYNNTNAHRENVKGARVFWCDFDGNAPVDLAGVPEPTLKVVTSDNGREHWYWRLETYLSSDALETTNRALTYLLGADGSGWDAPQVLRPPNTINHKRNRTTRLIRAEDLCYSGLDFSQYEAPPRIIDELQLAEIPDAYDVVMQYAWSKQAMELYRARGEETDRSSALMQLGYFCAEMGMSDAEMFSIIRNADDRWGKFKGRTDRDRRLTDLISVTRAKYARPDTLEVIGLQSLLATEIKIEWAIEGLLQQQGYMLLTGRSGVGKTQLSLRFAIALALGKDYLGYSVGPPRKLLFFSLEMGKADLIHFLTTMTPKITPEDMSVLEENLLFVPLGESLYLNKPEVQANVERLLTSVDPAGIFFDSLGSMSDEELSSETLVKAIMDWDSSVRKRFNVFTWYIHHQRKAQATNKKPTDLSDVYGSHYITARATSVYCLWPEGEQIEVSCLKKRLARQDKPYRLERFGDLEFERVENISKVEQDIELNFLSGEELHDATGFGLDL